MPASSKKQAAGPPRNAPSVSDEHLLAIQNRMLITRREQLRALRAAHPESFPPALPRAPETDPETLQSSPKPPALTLQQLLSKFQQELKSVQKVASSAEQADLSKSTMWFRLCADAFELLQAVGIDNEAALRLISIRHLVAENNTMEQVVRHVLRDKLEPVHKESEQLLCISKATEEKVESESDQSSLEALLNAEVGPYHPDVDADLF